MKLPLAVNFHETKPKLILDRHEILDLSTKYIAHSRMKLKHKVSIHLTDEVKLFIKTYYHNDPDFKFVYSADILEWFCRDAYIMTFHSKTDKLIGVMIGKPKTIVINFEEVRCLEVNYLCLIPQLREMNITKFMIYTFINHFAQECEETIAYYTTGTAFSQEYFSKKLYYHRIIQLDTCLQTKMVDAHLDSDVFRKVYKTFSVPRKYSSTFTIHLNSLDYKADIYDKLASYNMENHKIFHLDIDEYNTLWDHPDFYHFCIVDNDNQVMDYICTFMLNTETPTGTCRNMYIYKWFFKNSKSDIIEYVSKYVNDHDIADMITFVGLLSPDELMKSKCLKGSSNLYYYFFNLEVPCIKYLENALVTI